MDLLNTSLDTYLGTVTDSEPYRGFQILNALCDKYQNPQLLFFENVQE